MRKNLFVVALMALICLTGCNAPEQTDLEEAAQPIKEALVKEGFEMQRETKVYDMTFENAEGSKVLYHICLTTYYAADPGEVTGLDTEALYAVFAVEDAILQEELLIAGRAAAYYQGDDKMYLCCTSSPEATLILEYDPDAVPQEDMFRMMESVFIVPES